jgi:hypothetical protein
MAFIRLLQFFQLKGQHQFKKSPVPLALIGEIPLMLLPRKPKGANPFGIPGAEKEKARPLLGTGFKTALSPHDQK